MTGIYKITNLSGRIYIGQSWNIERRANEYKRKGAKGQSILEQSIRKYGWSNHNFEIIQTLPSDISQEVLNNYEVFYWKQYKDTGYSMMNVREPGSKGKHSKRTRLLMSIAQKGKTRTKEHSLNISKAKKGIKLGPNKVKRPRKVKIRKGKFFKKVQVTETGEIIASHKEAALRFGVCEGTITYWIRIENKLRNI